LDLRFGLGLLGVIVVAVVVGLIAAQSQSKAVSAPLPTVVATPIPTPRPNYVEIVSDPSNPAGFFAPTSLTIQVGHPVTFSNNDTNPHSVIADNGAFNSGVLTPGETFTWTPKKIGRIGFSDYLVPSMHGSLEVVSFAVSG
jgi:plastocyanin